jgi:hypothetical protein
VKGRVKHFIIMHSMRGDVMKMSTNLLTLMITLGDAKVALA